MEAKLPWVLSILAVGDQNAARHPGRAIQFSTPSVWFPGIFCPLRAENIRGLYHYRWGTTVAYLKW